MKLAFGVQKMLGFMLIIIATSFPGISGLIIGDTNSTVCNGTAANITFDVRLQNETITSGSEAWYYETIKIANYQSGVFSPLGNYTGRLHPYSSYGLTLYNVTYDDRGRYYFEFYYTTPTSFSFGTSTATLAVIVSPSNTCVPSYSRQSGNLLICELANCGSGLVPVWNHTSGNSFTIQNDGNYTCCANGSILTDCNLGFNTFCKTFNLTVEKQDEEKNTGKIVGGTVGGFIGLCLLVFGGRVIYVFCKIKKEGKPALGVKALIKKILICDFCSHICDKQKKNSVGGDHAIVSKQVEKPHGGNGSKSSKPGDGNGQEKSTESEPKHSMSDVSRNDVQIQMEEGHVKLYVESPQVNPSRLGHQDEANHKSVQSKPFDQKESRPLPPQPGNNNQNKRGISANFDDKQGLAHDTPQAPKLAQSLAHDTPRAINLAPIDPQLLSNKQNEGTSENSRKKKKKKKNKNKKTDEIKSTDDLGE